MKRPFLDRILQQTDGVIADRIYTGVGSRETPPEILAIMTTIASALARLGYQVSTGDAGGADAAFRRGDAKAIVYRAADATPMTIAIAKELHPAPQHLGEFPMKLMARNTNQVFGRELSYRTAFLVCWTPDGCECHRDRQRITGGTGQAISLASFAGRPVFNLARPDALRRLVEHLKAIGVGDAGALDELMTSA